MGADRDLYGNPQLRSLYHSKTTNESMQPTTGVLTGTLEYRYCVDDSTMVETQRFWLHTGDTKTGPPLLVRYASRGRAGR